MENEEQLLKLLSPDMLRIFRAIKMLGQYGGNGSIEVHFVRGIIKTNNGLYIKPGFCDDTLQGEKTDNQLNISPR